MEIGPSEEQIARQARLAGEPLPDRIANKPKLGFSLDFFLECFFELDSDRNWIAGTGPQALSFTNIHKYATVYGITGQVFNDFIFIIRKLDSAYTQYLSKKR